MLRTIALFGCLVAAFFLLIVGCIVATVQTTLFLNGTSQTFAQAFAWWGVAAFACVLATHVTRRL